MQPTDEENTRDCDGDLSEKGDGTISKTLRYSEALDSDRPPSPSVTICIKDDPESLLKSERDATRAAIEEPDLNEDDYPDGGLRAWFVLLGVCSFCSAKL